MSDELKENLIGKQFQCLDKGFVRVIDVMGNDSSIVQAARVSYGAGTKTVNEDKGLIRYLMRHKHTSPFEMVEFKFHIKLPIFVARQWIRHRTANVNEYSGRYSEMPDDFYLPDTEEIRTQSTINKQGRSSEKLNANDAEEIIQRMNEIQQILYDDYKNLLNKDVAREIARINLPLSTYTEWYWKIDLHNLFHFLKLRLDEKAQYEIRLYAETIAKIVKHFVPLAYEAFEDYILNSVTFSRDELNILKEAIDLTKISDDLIAKNNILALEAREFKQKLNNFSL